MKKHLDSIADYYILNSKRGKSLNKAAGTNLKPDFKDEGADFNAVKSVVIVDNDKLKRIHLREAIKVNKSFKVESNLSYTDSLINELYTLKPDIIVFSSFVSNEENIDMLNKIKQDLPLAKTIIVADKADEILFCKAIKAGIKAYCLSDYTADKMFNIVNKITNGGHYYDHSMDDLVYRVFSHMSNINQLPIDKPIHEQLGLTQKELEVLGAIARYDTYKKAAEHLYISPSTIKAHLSNIYRKFNVKTKLQAVLKAYEMLYGFVA